MDNVENIGRDKRVVFLQRLADGTEDALEPVSNLASPIGYCYEMAQEIFETRPGEEVKQLDHLAGLGYLDRQFFDKIHLCVCERRQFAINFREVCVKCRSSNIDITDMIHHYSCGYTGAEPEFQDGIRYVCPKCDEELKHIGVDYEKVSTDYVCAACGHVFTEPDIGCQCLACEQRFDVERAFVRTLYIYRINAKGTLVASRGTMEGEITAGSLIDPELNVYSFDYFEERLAQEFAGAIRYKRPLSVVAAEIDRLDAFEAAHGRQASARKLRDFAAIAKESLRDSDAAAVFDQTILVLILTDTPFDGASVLANRLRDHVGRLNEGGDESPVTVSVGFTSLSPDMSGPQAMFDDAMERLREGRRDGGDCVRPAVSG
jgi:diguanylate cyclase (GGDEF)-like protein